MGAWFQCTNCEARYLFDASQTGRAIACRACGYVFRVPPVPVSTVPHPGALPSSGGRWLLQFPSGRRFGPVVTRVIEEWVREGRADADSLVCPEGAEECYRLGDAFPDLAGPVPRRARPESCGPVTSLAEQIPAAGLLAYLPDHRDRLPTRMQAQHKAAEAALAKEVRRALGAVRLLGTRSVITGTSRQAGGFNPQLPEKLHPENLLVAELTAHGSAFYCIVPWGSMGRLSHEFFSILPGRLPHSVALRRASEHDFGDGRWIGIDGTANDVMALAAGRSREDLASGIVWNWFSRRRDYTMVQVWGLQAVPLGAEKFLHIMQTSSRTTRGKFGLLWYLERQSAFYRLARRLSLPDTHESHILFGCCTGQILIEIVDHFAGCG